jgi:hypothetical protein
MIFLYAYFKNYSEFHIQKQIFTVINCMLGKKIRMIINNFQDTIGIKWICSLLIIRKLDN